MSDLTGKRIPKQTLHGSIYTNGSSNPLRGNVMTRGLDGKSAYEYAVSKGYTGTEEEFAEKLAADWARKEDIPENLTGSYNDLTDRPVYEDYYIEWLEKDLVVARQPGGLTPTGVNFTNPNINSDILVDNDIVVIYDGVEYINPTKYVTEVDNDIKSIGNKHWSTVTNINTGEPFYIVCNPSSNKWFFYGKQSTTTHTVSIGVKLVDFKQLDEKFIPDSYTKKLAEQVKPDWSQCDENAYSHIKGRTHYTEYDYSNVLVPIGDYTTVYTGTPVYNYKSKADISSLVSGLVVGNIYKVVFNDVEYLLEAKVTSTNGSVYLGNAYIISNTFVDTEEPFFIRNDNILLTNNEMSLTLSIAEQKIIVHKLDEKYIPDTIAKKSDIPCYTETTIIPETRTVSTSLLDADFTQLLLKNRQSAEYLSNDKSFVYERDVSGSVIGWAIVSEDGTRVFITAGKNSADSVVEDRINVRGPVLQITVNDTKEIVHQLDEKYIPNKYYTEYCTVQTTREFKTGTMFIDGNSNPDDMEFVQLVLNNRQTTTFNIDGITYTYKEDMNDAPEESTLWSIVSENGAELLTGITAYNRLLILPQFNDTCVISITHNGIKEIHQIDPKYIKDMYYDTSNRVYVNESIDVGNAKEVDEGLWNALITGNHKNILLDGYHLEMLPVEDPYMHSFSVHEYRLDVFGDSHAIGLMPLGAPPSEPTTCAITGYYETGELKQLDEKYIPDTIARKSDISWNDLEDKPFYTEYVTKTKTKTFENGLLREEDFVQLYLNNVETSQVLFNDEEWAFNRIEIFDETNEHLVYYTTPSNDEYMFALYSSSSGSVVDCISVPHIPGVTTIYTFNVNYQVEIIHKMDEKYLALEAHTHSYDDLTDKTHGLDYKNGEVVELIAEQAMTVTTYPLDGRLNAHNVFESNLDMKVDDEITLIIDGEIYVGIVKELKTEDGNLIYYVGNPRLMSGMGENFPSPDTSYDNTLAYCLALSNRNALIRVRIGTPSMTSINIKATTKRPILTQLDEKYIPDTIARKSDIVTGGSGGSSIFTVEFTMTGSQSVTTETTVAEITEAYQSGKIVKANVIGMKLECSGIFNNGIGFQSILAGENGIDVVNILLSNDGVGTFEISNINIGIPRNLATESKELVGAINELHSKFGDIESICDEVIALQNSYINGVKVTQEGDTLIIQNGGDADA